MPAEVQQSARELIEQLGTKAVQIGRDFWGQVAHGIHEHQPSLGAKVRSSESLKRVAQRASANEREVEMLSVVGSSTKPADQQTSGRLFQDCLGAAKPEQKDARDHENRRQRQHRETLFVC